MKKLLPTTLAILGLASAAIPAFGQGTVVRLAGATTYRAPVHKAILDILDTSTHNIDFTYKGSSQTLFKSGAALFHGFLKSNGQEVTIKTLWTGSVAGVVDVGSINNIGGASNSTGWIDSSVIAVSTSVYGGQNPDGSLVTDGAQASPTKEADPGSPPNIAMSDSFRASTQKAIQTEPTNGRTIANTIGTAGLIDNKIGVVPFAFVAGAQNDVAAAQTLAPFSNVTTQVARQLENAGFIQASAFTGSTSDNANFVFLIGRNEDSGSRVAAQAEPRFNYGQSSLQYQGHFTGTVTQQGASGGNPAIDEGGSAAQLSQLSLWPANWVVNTVTSLNWNTSGHSGFNGGGDVAAMLAATSPVNSITFFTNDNGDTGQPGTFTGSSKAYLVGYLGIADAVGSGSLDTNPASATFGKITGGGVPNGRLLTYNGAPYSVANIQNGRYSFWEFEHLFYKTGGANGLPNNSTGQKVATDLVSKISTTDAPTNSSGVTDATQTQLNSAGILLDSNFKVSRTDESSPVFFQ
jgi:hypothetical protein